MATTGKVAEVRIPPVTVTIDEPSSNPLSFLTDNAITSTINDFYANLSEKRKLLGLSNPGTVENIAMEVQRDVLTTYHMFTGLRCDLQKLFSVNPSFRMQHGFAMGSNVLPPWQMLAMYGNSRTLLQTTFSSDQSVSALLNFRLTPSVVLKTQTQIQSGSQSMLHTELTKQFDDANLSVKAINPSIIEGGLTGIIIGDYMQSITPALSLGIEGVWQRAGLNAKPETAISYAARYKTADWIASAQLGATGSIGGSYWRRLSEKVEAGADVQLQFAPGMGGGNMFANMRKEGEAKAGVKYSFIQSVYRASLSSGGEVAITMEKRVAPAINISFAAAIDQFKGTHKLGLGVSLEGMPEELEQQMQTADPADQGSPPPY